MPKRTRYTTKKKSFRKKGKSRYKKKSRKNFKSKRNFPKKVANAIGQLGGDLVYSLSGSSHQDSGQGRVNFFSPDSTYNRNINNSLLTANGGNDNVNFFGSQTLPDKQWFVKRWKIDLMITNSGNTPAVITAHWCVARTNSPRYSAPNTAHQGNIYQDIIGGIKQKMNADDENGENFRNLGVTPYTSIPFNERWKITMSKKFILDPGCPVLLNVATAGVHKMTVGLNTSGAVFPEGEVTDNPFYQKGLSKCILFQWHGIPVANADKTTVTTSNAALDFVWNHKVHMMSSFGQTRNIMSVNAPLDAATQMQIWSDVIEQKADE